MYNNKPHLDWKYDNKYVHNHEKDIAELLRDHNLKFIYRQPTYLYNLDSRPCLASPSFTIDSLKDLIVDYSPLNSSFDRNYKKNIYEQNDLDAIVINRAYFEKEKWDQNLYHNIMGYLNRYI